MIHSVVRLARVCCVAVALLAASAVADGCGGPSFTVTTDPPGASVYLHYALQGTNYTNDRYMGQTPLEDWEAPESMTGRYQMRIELEGYQPILRSVQLPLASDLMLSMALKPVSRD